MAKKRRKKRHQRKNKIKESIRFEIYGLSLLAFSLLALIQPGAFGEVLRAFFRFFAGSWDFLIPLSLFGLSVYLMIKRSWPKEWHYRWTGIAVFLTAILIMNHLRLVENVMGSAFEQQSVLLTTWNLFWEDVSSDIPVQLGGGMVGAVLFATLNTLFASSGTLIIVSFMFMISFLLLIGLSFQDMYRIAVKAAKSVGGWMQRKGSDLQELMNKEDTSRTDKKKEEEQQPTPKRKNRKGIPEAEMDETGSVSPSQIQPPSSSDLEIYDFTDVAYEQAEMDFPEFKNEAQTLPSGEQRTERRTKEMSTRTQAERRSSSTPEHALSEAEALNFRNEAQTTRQGVVTYGHEDDNYQLPPFAFLKKQPRNKNIQKQDMKSRARKLEQTLESFGVNAQVTQVHRGPAVTRYEVHPAVGVKVSRVVNLADDIALALAARGIRIEAPIPGKSAIGIEVPNDDVSMVTFREVLESSSFHESKSKLSIALGRDISGEPIVAHLNKMPHLLVAGATGSGKSVCVNGMIASILYKAKPHEVKLMMIDPKMVELNVYNGIPHLLAPVVTDPKKAALALKKIVSEMERRYELFADSGTRNIEGYNHLIRKHNEQNKEEEKKPLLPYIVVIIDELADLMMVAPGDVEDAIIRIAQMARAAGIHLLIATQRPSVDVITGIIKANIPSRIAFGVSSQTDSRTILDSGGAEKLLGKGDMLFLPVGASKTLRIQGAFISDDEVEKLVEHCIQQQKASYNEEMIPQEGEDSKQQDQIEDDLYPKAVQLVIQQGHASVSMLQRRFRIGYTRAARLIDAMEVRGIVGPYEGSKPREVLVAEDESHIS